MGNRLNTKSSSDAYRQAMYPEALPGSPNRSEVDRAVFLSPGIGQAMATRHKRDERSITMKLILADPIQFITKAALFADGRCSFRGSSNHSGAY
jgi:hypothetical protein